VGNAEILFPMPGIGMEKSVRLSAFVDAGNVWGYGSPVSFSDVRYSMGLSASWNSPFGPLKFSFANPVRSKPDDKIQRLQFQLGSTF
jgi:outer membrane protein insertion porin family